MNRIFTHCAPGIFSNIKFRPIYINIGRNRAIEITNSRPNPRSSYSIGVHPCYIEKCKECKYGLRLVLGKCKTSKYYESI